MQVHPHSSMMQTDLASRTDVAGTGRTNRPEAPDVKPTPTAKPPTTVNMFVSAREAAKHEGAGGSKSMLTPGQIRQIICGLDTGHCGTPPLKDAEVSPKGGTVDKPFVSARDAAGQIAPGEPGGGGTMKDVISAALAKLDLDGDTRITAEEAPFGKGVFSALDRDADGAITANELADSLSERFTAAREANPHLDADTFVSAFLFSPQADIAGGRGADGAPSGDGETSVAPTTPAIVNGAGPADPANDQAPTISARQMLADLARDIAERLEAQGHTDRPPVNIRDLISELNLNQTSSNFVMQMLASRFPQGLGISMLG